jgi:putative ABC transport system permease protein
MPDFMCAIEQRLEGLPIAPARRTEIALELSQHLQDRYDELRAAGASHDDASREAFAELDGTLSQQLAGVERHEPRESAVLGRRRGGASMIGSIWQDVRYAARMARQAPAFTAVVVLTLALAIGATTAIFSVADGVMLRPFPYPDIDRIMILNETVRGGQSLSVAWPNFQDWRDQNEVFEQFGLYRAMTVNLTGGDQPERLNGTLVSSEVFKALGIQAQAGRTFLPQEDQPGADHVVVVSDRLWRSHFNSDPALVGRTMILDGQAHAIVGIVPPGMRFPSRLTDVWLPLGLFVDTFPADRGTHPGLTVIGKLKPGVSLEQANANMDAIARRLEKQYPMLNTDHTAVILPYYEQIVQNIRPALLTLIGAVGFVLLIGCANLANLMLARADRRQREIAVRAALGAEPYRLFQQLLIESVLLSLFGGALGALMAVWGVNAFVASRPTSIPRIDLIAVDLRVLAFTAAVSIITGILFGLAPALRASSPDLLGSLKEAARSSTSAAGRRLRSGLVVAEVALALVLLIGAGLMVKSFGRLMALDLGFNPARVVTMRLALPGAKYPELARWLAFHQELVSRIGSLPAIEAAGLNSAVPLEGGGAESEVIYEGQPPPRSVQEPGTMCLFQMSSPDYFRAMGIPLLKGRSFTEHDTAESSLVAVVDDTLVRRLFPNADPIGKRIAFEFRGHGPDDPRPIWREIVGVVRHVHHYGLIGEPPNVQVYAPFQQIPIWFQQRRPSMALVARTTLDPERLAASIRREVAALDRDIPIYRIQTMDTYLTQNTEQSRLSVMLLSVFSALALVLAVLGIYGVLSYVVGLRSQEIGIRMALGATCDDVLRLIVGHGMLLATVGIVLGLGASWGITKSLGALLFEVSPHDPATFALITLLLAAVAFVACYLPGRRATRVDPAITLKSE